MNEVRSSAWIPGEVELTSMVHNHDIGDAPQAVQHQNVVDHGLVGASAAVTDNRAIWFSHQFGDPAASARAHTSWFETKIVGWIGSRVDAADYCKVSHGDPLGKSKKVRSIPTMNGLRAIPSVIISRIIGCGVWDCWYSLFKSQLHGQGFCVEKRRVPVPLKEFIQACDKVSHAGGELACKMQEKEISNVWEERV